MRWTHRLALAALSCATATATASAADDHKITLPGNPIGICWGFLYGYHGAPKAEFVPQVRELGAGFTKIYVMWNQLEPEKGKYDFSAVDAYLDQLKSPDEGLIAVFSSSTWATRTQTPLLPPSPAKDPADYDRFIRALVAHCKGKVRYWQNDSEPNNPVFWNGTADEFVAELKTFGAAVRASDPDAKVVCGGYDGLFTPPGAPGFHMPNQEKSLAFFDKVMHEAKDSFDIFDIRLYSTAESIPARVKYIRDMLTAAGSTAPIICTEYNGPGFFEFVPNLPYVGIAANWNAGVAGSATQPYDTQKSGVAALYAKMKTLAPQTQMFMDGASPELEARFERMQANDLVIRNVLAFSVGVQKTAYWDICHDTSDRNDLMHLMFAKHRLYNHDDALKLSTRHSPADAFERCAKHLAGLTEVREVTLTGMKDVHLFEIVRKDKPSLFVTWRRTDAFLGETFPPLDVHLPWTNPAVTAEDASGKSVPTTVADGKLTLQLHGAPVFLEP